MTDKVREIMALVEQYARDCAKAYCENLYGTSKSYTKQCFEEADKARAAIESRLRVVAPPVPEPGERERHEIAWTDKDGVHHSMGIEGARALLEKFWDEWPGGWSEVEAEKAARASLPPAPELVAGWQPIETAPKDGRTLLLGYFNSHGKWRTLRGQWMSRDYIDEYWEDPEGVTPWWFETVVEADEPPNCWATEPTHWQALPPAPKEPT